MFGYIRACKPELRIKEFEMYKAIYCSLCKELGKSYGILARLTLSYDFTFLAMLYMALNDKDCKLVRKCCTCNPLKKCSYLEDRTELALPAAAAMILLYYKILDNISDEKGLKRLGYLLARPLFGSAYKKAAKAYPALDKIAKDYVEAQQKLETDGCDDLDFAAEPTAQCMSQIFMLLTEDEFDKRCLERMGYLIGRYIYILDAAADLSDDIKQGKYNPLKFINGRESLNKELIAPLLNVCIAETAKAYELINIKKFKNILDNLVYLGLQDTFKKELKI